MFKRRNASSSVHNVVPIRAVVKDISSTDVDLATFAPRDSAVVGEWLTILVGTSDTPNGDLFDVCACTPGYLSQWVLENGPTSGRFHMIFSEWNTREVLTTLTNLVENTTGDSWDAIGRKLSKSLKWEFDDNL